MCIHGDKKQEERDWVLKDFRNGSTTILVATDVAARGLGMSYRKSFLYKFFFLAAVLFFNNTVGSSKRNF